MADVEESAMVIDADAIVDVANDHSQEVAAVEDNNNGTGEPTNEVTAVSTESAPDVITIQDSGEESKVFTSVDQEEGEVQYVTMTQEEAEAAGIEEDDQVVTTSLQFDPSNPSVLYTADGTPINQADLSPEEQALVQAALQQHLAEQEAEQQLALIEQTSTDAVTAMETQVTATESTTVVTTSNALTQDILAVASTEAGTYTAGEPQLTIAESAEPVAIITPAPAGEETSRVDIVSSAPSASSIVQSIANSVRREEEYKKAQDLIERATESNKSDLPEGYRLEEKIVIRQGQPQVVKVPVRAAAQPKRPEIPPVLANLMPKVEVGKDGSQVIRIHQSQITADQLKSLQENPNVRLVFRPASGSRGRGASSGATVPYGYPRKRGRPRKHYISAYSSALNRDDPTKPRTPKTPYYQKDHLLAMENGEMETDSSRPYVPGRRGRPPGSHSRGYRRNPSYSRRMENLREQEFRHDEELNNARLSIVPQKPVLSGVELAISTRRKNRLRELLSACSEEEIMEVALPHLARVFSLWEFLVMKVEKQKMSRVYFADVYKEYEILHRYVSRLTLKYKQALMQEKLMNPAKDQPENGESEDPVDSIEKEKKNMIKVRCKLLAQSLGLEQDELEDAFITLLDAEEIVQLPPKVSKAAVETKESDESATNVTSNDKSEAQTETSKVEPEKKTDDTAATDEKETKQDAEKSETTEVPMEEGAPATNDGDAEGEAASGGTQIIQIGTGDDKQFIEVPEGYTLIQTPEGLVMSQPGTTLSQAEDGTIYVTHEDGFTTTLDSQKAVPLESFDSLLTEDQQAQQEKAGGDASQ